MMLAALLVASEAVLAAYSAPLTRVHIGSSDVSHTPQLVYVSDLKTMRFVCTLWP